MADRILLPIALDANGDPVAGAEAYFYLTGTSTPATVYAEAAATTPLASPQLASSAGVFETPAFATAALRVDLKDPTTGTSLPGFPQDSWYIVPNSAGSAGGISFSPVVGNAATDVQTAIENNVTSLAGKQPLDAQLSAIASLTPAANKIMMFTALESASLLDFVDEDNMASDSATAVPSQQSVKAYVDANVYTTPGHLEVGDFVWARLSTTSTSIALGDEVDGASLYSSGLTVLTSSNGNQFTSGTGTQLTGGQTWRAKGSCDGRSGAYASTMWKRIS